MRDRRRCRLHGGKSTGARTPEGLERIRRAATKHGFYSRGLIAERRRVRKLVADARSLLAGLGQENGLADVKREAKEFCCELLDGEAYRRKLRQRLLAGKVSPAFEATLWHYAGVPSLPYNQPVQMARAQRGIILLLRLEDTDFGAGGPPWSPITGRLPVRAGQRYRLAVGLAGADLFPEGAFTLTTAIE